MVLGSTRGCVRFFANLAAPLYVLITSLASPAFAGVQSIETLAKFSTDCNKTFPRLYARGQWITGETGVLNVTVPKDIPGSSFAPFAFVLITRESGYLSNGSSILGVQSHIDLAHQSTITYVVSLDSKGHGSVSIPIGNLSSNTILYAQAFAANSTCSQGQFSTSYPVKIQTGDVTDYLPTQMTASITHRGRTITFDKQYRVGFFANGDPFVEPDASHQVKIIGFDPPAMNVSDNGTRAVNGATLNPRAMIYTTSSSQMVRHGFDRDFLGGYDEGAHYDPSLNKALGTSAQSPLILSPRDTLVSIISQVGTPTSGSAAKVKNASVLTVIERGKIPSADALRPGYVKLPSTSTYLDDYALRDFNVTALRNLSPVQGTPNLSTLAQQFSGTWLDLYREWNRRYNHPVDSMPDYYRSHTALTGTALLALNTNFTLSQKRDFLRTGFAQLLSDWTKLSFADGDLGGINGHNNGHFALVATSGYLTGNASALNRPRFNKCQYYGPSNSNNITLGYSELCQTDFITQTAPNEYHWNIGGYTSIHHGVAEWMNFGHDSANSTWDLDYRVCCSANGWMGQTLALLLMGLDHYIEHPAYFAYHYRYISTMLSNNAPTWQIWWDSYHRAAWENYIPLVQ